MSSLTKNLKLVKPELQDNITPTIFADNFDKIDAALEGVSGGALSLEEIEASTNLDGKIPSAAALKEVNNSLENKIGLPDYNNRISVVSANTQKGSFTATNNGILYLLYNIKDGYMVLTINDNSVGNVIVGCGTSYYVQPFVTFILSKGDTITWEGNTANAFVTSISSFFPFK